MSIHITDIAFTGTPVTDMKRARAFYEGVLGLKPTHLHGESWVEYDIGPGKNTLALAQGSPEWKPSPQGTTAALEVADFDAALAHCKASKVAITSGPYDTPVCRMAIIGDPDGNSIALHSRKKA
jgi:predicted enzyme related to lactoylglutathione lyase